MGYTRYTTCFNYPEGGKPYNEKDRLSWIIIQLLLALVVAGVFAAAGAPAGPIGAIIGGFVGSIVAFTNFIQNAADAWLNRRLVCLSKDNPKCAVGIVSYNPSRSDLGIFDNDQYFDVVLMPHPAELVDTDRKDEPFIYAGNPKWLMPANRYKDPNDVQGGYTESLDKLSPNPVVDSYAKYVAKFPENDLLNDGFQAEKLLSPREDLFNDLGYEPLNKHERVALHCEAEGDFWVRMKKLAPALAILIDAALAVTAAGAAAGAWSGSALGCALGAWFFGPIGCAIGAWIGGALGGAAGAVAAGAASYFGVIEPILQNIFDAGPGDVEDANVGDKSLGPIRMGDAVVVVGEHVYDGYHTGWHEFHPLMAVAKIANVPFRGVGSYFYLTWNPNFPPGGLTPVSPPGAWTAAKKPLMPFDMEQGLSSFNFRLHCQYLRETWCRMLRDAMSDDTVRTQQEPLHRWTIHPAVDGCQWTNDGESGLH